MPHKRNFIAMASTSAPPLSRSILPTARVKKVWIGWKSILDDVVNDLGGTKPVYTVERTRDGMFLSSVCFWLPVSKSRKERVEIKEAGMISSSAAVAEEQAAYSALGRFEATSFGMQIMDVSRLLLEEMKIKCRAMLIKLGELNHATRLVLDEWSRAIGEIESACHNVRSDVIEDFCNRKDPMYREIQYDVGQQLLHLKNANEVKLKEIGSRCEEVFRNIDEETDFIRRHFEERIIPRASEKKGEFPGKVTVNMKLVLDEMMNSLGWKKPLYTTCKAGDYYHVGHADFIPMGSEDDSVGKVKTIRGGKKLNRTDAIESAASAVVFFLDKEMSIQLVDINYNSRLSAEVYIAKAERLIQLASSIATEVFAEWKNMAKGLDTVDYYCRKMAADHPNKDPCDWMCNVKCDLADTVARLYVDCEFRLSLGESRYKAAVALFNI